MVKRIAKKFSLGKLAFLTIFLTIIFLLVLFYSHILNPTSIKKTTFSSYRNNINYQVFLRNNNFISKPSLGMNQAYIASMVDSIHVSFGQTATFQKMTSFRYDYTIYAKLSAVYPTENGEEEIWSQVYPLKVQDTKSVREKMLSITDQVSISYWDYQAVVNNFKNTYHLKVDATLDIIMDVRYEYQNQEAKSSSLLLSIPMNQEVFKITTDYKKEDSVVQTEKVSNMTIPAFVVLFFLVVIGLSDIFACTLLFVKLLQLYSITEYERMKQKIKKDYGSIIVDVDNAIDFSNFTIFEIKSIEELVDLEEELRIPILFYEKKKARICYFVIIKDHYMYRFTLRDMEQEII